MASSGNAHFAASPDDAPGIFAKEFSDLVSLVAQNVSGETRRVVFALHVPSLPA